MNLKDAKQAGVKAFNDGRGRAPALNNKFVQSSLVDSKLDGEIALVEMFEGYLMGWDIANLADGMGPEFPSVKALAEIWEGPAA